MLALLADMKSGEVGTAEIPAPVLGPGSLLVRTAFSAISAGTESSTVATSKKSLLGKALARPDLVKQVLEFAKTNGMKAAYQKVQSRLEVHSTLGYSCAGTVLAVGDEVSEFRPGDRVACGGQGLASHSEINCVPRNLAVKVPDGVPLDAACLTTIGAIAIQGLRQANVSFGENVVVIGAGLVGILTVQLARAAGCNVIAIDSNPYRAARAAESGASLGITASDPLLLEILKERTKYGADAAIVTASSDSTEPVELAARVLRDRGRIVVLGAVPLGVSRELMYAKELSLVLSRSYGPGRYDPGYEDLGNDYPIGYVRWTEQRNMEAFVQLLSAGGLKLDPLLELRVKIEHGAQAYEQIQRTGAYTAILEYASARDASFSPRPSRIEAKAPSDSVRVGCIGAGSFARSMIFPQLRSLDGVRLEAIAASSGSSAFSAQKTFRFHQAMQPQEVLDSPDIDAVFVLSRHNSHASYVVSALQKQKPIFVEKPLATSLAELGAIRDAYRKETEQNGSPFVMVGFNRRFSPAFDQIRQFFAGRQESMLIHIRVNAGCLPREHWVQQNGQGGRVVGEVCHFLDSIRYIASSDIVSVYARALPDGTRYSCDNLAIVVSLADGSVGNILYLANGDRSVRKEYYEVFSGGGVARLDDFKSLELIRNQKRKHLKCHQDKGHRNELQRTIDALRKRESSPISFADSIEVTAASFAVIDSLKCGLPVKLEGYLDAAEMPN